MPSVGFPTSQRWFSEPRAGACITEKAAEPLFELATLQCSNPLSISRMGEVAGGACWKVWGCLWRMCGWMKLKLCGNVIQIHGKAKQVLQSHSEPPRHSKQPSQPAFHPPPHLPPRAICQAWAGHHIST